MPLKTLTLRPGEEQDLNFTFVYFPEFAAGDTIASVPVVTIEPMRTGMPTVQGSPTDDGVATAQARFVAGDGPGAGRAATYVVKWTVVTAGGRTRIGTGLLRIEDVALSA